MKIALVVIRTLLGLLLLVASLAYFFNLAPQPELEGNFRRFNEGVAASAYLLPLAKGVELACGLALVSGFFLPLAVVVLFPLSLNIFLIHLFLEPAGLPVAAFLLLGNLFLAYACRRHYAPLFSARIHSPFST